MVTARCEARECGAEATTVFYCVLSGVTLRLVTGCHRHCLSWVSRMRAREDVDPDRFFMVPLALSPEGRVW